MAVQAILDGTDVTQIVQEGSVTHRFNLLIDEASIRVPSALTSAGPQSDLQIYLNGNLDFNGSVELIEDHGDEDTMYTVFTALDPSFIYNWRPARDADGDFSDPSFLEDFVTGPQIFQQILQNSITHEGPLGIQLGTFATGGISLVGAPTTWPATLAQVGGLLVSTGEVDIIHTAISAGDDQSRVDVYNGNYGANLSGSVEFRFATGSSSNSRGCRRVIDKREMVNKLWDYMSPRKNQQQWWGGNITGDHPSLNDPPFNAWQPTIIALRDASRIADRVRFLFQSWDQFSNRTEATISKPLYLRRWQMESYLRAQPKVLVEIVPHRGIAPTFRCGDRIGVTAGPSFRGGFSGLQRVMEYTWRWDTEGVIELGSPVGQAGVPAVTTSSSAERPA